MGKSLMGSFREMRRPELADLMLLVTVVIWSLNFTVTKYVLNHGFKPLAYGGGRFAAAALLFPGLSWAEERPVPPRPHDIPFMVGGPLVGVFLDQVTLLLAAEP